jgi:uncharacterized membrane protein
MMAACDARGLARLRIFLLIGFYLGFLTFRALGSGMLEMVAMPYTVALAVYLARTRSVPILPLVGLVLLLAVLNTAKFAVREEIWGTNQTQMQKVAAWGRALQNVELASVFKKDAAETGTSAMRTLMYRFALLTRLGWVRINTPEFIPYFRGESYEYFLYALVPRVIWPNKPAANDATSMLDNAYDLKIRGSDTYSIGVGYIGEAYANFSWAGVLVVMAALGLAIGLSARVLNGAMSYGGAAIYVVCGAVFINGIGSSIVVLCGNLLQISICFVILIWPFAGRLTEDSWQPMTGATGHSRGTGCARGRPSSQRPD